MFGGRFGSSEKKNGNSDVTVITSTEDFLNFLGQDESLCVIKFHADWCKSCQKFGVKYRQLAAEERIASTTTTTTDGDDTTDHVRFAEIEFAANARLCRSMGITKLPTIHFYKGRVGKIDAFPCGPQKFPLLQEKLLQYRNMSDDELEFHKTLKEGAELMMDDHVVTELKQQHYQDALASVKDGTKS